jgi:hypothetical protein
MFGEIKILPEMKPGRTIYQHSKRLITLVAAALRWTTRVATAAVPKATAFLTRTSKAHAQITVSHAMSIEHADGLLRLYLVTHLNKRETLGLTAITVLDQRYRSDRACLHEQTAQILFRGGV